MTKVLLVEDDKSLREIYGVRLLAEGYDIVSAGDGEEALAMAIKERPALIVSDVMMPKISGFDMLDILRSTTETKDIKVIMMTALSSEDQRERGEKLGADRYLVKSQVGIEDVVRAVHEVLGDLPGMTSTTPAPTAQPTAPQPAPAPMTSPVPPAPAPVVQPVAPTAPQPEPTSLPRPTAPFSSASPRPANLGERVIQPIESSGDDLKDVASLMERELTGEAEGDSIEASLAAAISTPAPTPAPVAPMPVAQPSTPPLQPSAPPAPVAPTPQPATPNPTPVAPSIQAPPPPPPPPTPTTAPEPQPQAVAQPTAQPPAADHIPTAPPTV